MKEDNDSTKNGNQVGKDQDCNCSGANKYITQISHFEINICPKSNFTQTTESSYKGRTSKIETLLVLDGGLGDKWFIIGGGKSETKYAIVHRATATTPSKTLKKMKLINTESLMTDFYLHRSIKDVVFWNRFNGLLEENQSNP